MREPVAVTHRIGRRAMLAALAGAFATPGTANVLSSGRPERIATLDYGIGQTLIALGHPPLAIASAHAWNEWVVEPPLPPKTVNLGLSREINLELLQQLRPDLILSTPFLERLRGKLERIAPVVSLLFHATGGPAMPPILAATRAIAKLIGEQEAGEALIDDTFLAIAKAGEEVRNLGSEPFFVANFLDARHLRIYGRNSLFDDVMNRMGLRNAWAGPTNSWGFATVGARELASAGRARLVCFEPVPADAAHMLAESPVWRELGFAEAGRVMRLPPVLAFGMLPAARRFADLLAEAARV